MTFYRPTNILRSFVKKRSFSTETLGISVNDKNGIATVTLQRPPVNGFNLDFLEQFSAMLTDLEKNRSRGMILTSSLNTVFSAGVDISEMYKPEPERLRKFWITLQEVWLKLYGSSFPTAAAINGHAPAGGCLLAVSCEYRIMLPNFTIGLNETRLGIVAPTWLMASMRNIIGRRNTEIALTLGKLFKTEEALKLGLVDEVVESKEEALARSEAFILQFSNISPVARTTTKLEFRRKDLEDLRKNQQSDLNGFISFVSDEKVQEGLGVYLESLKKKRG